MLDAAELIFAKQFWVQLRCSTYYLSCQMWFVESEVHIMTFLPRRTGPHHLDVYQFFYSSAIFGSILILSILKFRCHFFFQTQRRVPWGFFSLSNKKTRTKIQHPTHKASVVCDRFHWVSGEHEPGSSHSTGCQELGTFHFPHYEDVNQMSLRFMKSGKILATSKGSSSGGKLGRFSYGFCCTL